MKLETDINLKSKTCRCLAQIKTELYKADLSESSKTDEPVLISEPLPDICPNCRKFINKQQIVLQFCDRTTENRFPDQWKARKSK
jgi:hypothetical protein